MDPSERLLRSDTYSDLTIACSGRTWKVHKAIVFPYSTYFQTRCQSAFSEAEKDKLFAEEPMPEIVDRALVYLYTKDYSDETDQIDESSRIEDPSEAVDVVTKAFKALEVAEAQEPVPSAEGSLMAEDSTTHAPANFNQPDEPQVVPMSSVMAEKARLDAITKTERQETENSRLEHSVTVRDEQLHKWQNSAKEIARLVNQTKGCLNQNCDVDFGARIESYGHGDLFRLRCRKCQMKHT